MHLSQTARLLTLLLIAMFMLTACGGGDDKSAALPMPMQEIVQPQPELELEAQRLPFPLTWACDMPFLDNDPFFCGVGGFEYRFGRPHYGVEALPEPKASDSQQAPIYHDYPGNEHSQARLFVGIDQGTQHIGGLPVVGMRSNMDIRHGNLNDGAGADVLAEYLGRTPIRRNTPAIVRFGGHVDEGDFNRLVRAVQLVNAALPPEWRMEIASDRPTTANPESGIHVLFWGGALDIDAIGHAESFVAGDPEYITHSTIQISRNYDVLSYRPDHRDDRKAIMILAHELIHALGIRHVSPDLDSIMSEASLYVNDTFPIDRNTPQPLSLLYPADREALRALYGQLEHGDSATDLSPWSAMSTHLHANGQHAAFGVAMHNGYGEPWAYGYLPETDLTDNTALEGTATWTGALLGFTPEAAPVAGDAEIGVNLNDLTGQADFTSLESWAAGKAPGNPGTEAMWNDGDLAYSIAVTGNTFRQTGGDDGILTGAFFGESHEGMGGTLEREDLTAAFGGSR